jgi:acyl transferase domain-containing protein/pimeloyl-ACP methyl ester carboxylesterase
MSSDARHDSAALMKRSLVEVRKLRARIEELERAGKESIAIVGIGCRFPGGARHPDAFWNLLTDERDAIGQVPADRWDVSAYYDPDPTAPGKVYVREGGFLEAVDGFDAHFFGIPPREAISLDPQQRILLEVAWEALEHACIAPDSLYGTGAGVFVGIGGFEFAAHLVRSVDPGEIDPHFGTGTALSAAAGRLSFTLGLTGPSMAIDTACSSSLVAVHIACQSLRNRECHLALAAGVNVLLAPEVNVAFSKARLLSADGRCRTFDEAADGYGRGEGCGVVVLKRLSDAIADGDAIAATILGSAVNQDGPSAALVVPNGLAQQAVIRAALDSAGIAANDVDYVEAHGTGTALGDPIEVGALAQVFGNARNGRPLVIGSVKTNVGHLESAAGIAGLIKVALSLRHETIPAHLHFRRPNPRIAWDLVSAEIPTTARSWPRGERRRLAGVSSFGFTGTNAHVILEEAPARDSAPPIVDRGAHVLTLSAKTAPALRAQATRFDDYASTQSDAAIGDICFSANVGRAHLRHRLSIVASSIAELRQRLHDFLAGREADGVFCNEGRGGRSKVAFLFSPPGTEHPDMGRELYDTHQGFRETFDRADQGPLVALQTALAELWKSWGIQPAAVWRADDRHASDISTASSAIDAIRRLREMGCNRFIEIGPDPVLLDAARDCLSGQDVVCIPSLRRAGSNWRVLATGLARFAIEDRSLNWAAFDQYYRRVRLPLPPYPFQRERFWIDGNRGGIRMPAAHGGSGVQDAARDDASPVFERLLAMHSNDRAAFLESHLKAHLARLLGPDAGDLSDLTHLPDASVDSLMVMDVLTALRNDLRFTLYPREFYEQPTIAGLARYLAAEFERTHGASSINDVRPAGAAVVGAAARSVDIVAVRDDDPGAAPPLRPSTMAETYVATPRGLRLCLCSWGPVDGPVALLVHGALSQAASWTETAEALAERGICVMAPDLRGHGHSDHVGPGTSYHTIDFVSDVDAIVRQAVGRPITLVGHSFGAAIAALLASARPEAVASVVLVEPVLPGNREPSVQGEAARVAIELNQLAQPARHATLPDIETAAGRMLRAVPGLSPALALRLAARDTTAIADGIEWRWDPKLRARAAVGFGLEPSTNARYLEMMRLLRSPITIVVGSEGSLNADAGTFLDQASRSGASIVRLLGGHNVHLQAPVALADIVARASRSSMIGTS